MVHLRAELDEFMKSDPMRAVRLTQASVLIQCVGALLASGASEDDVRSCFEQGIEHARHLLSRVRSDGTPGQQLDGALFGGQLPKISV